MKPKKIFGQNFLTSPDIPRKIAFSSAKTVCDPSLTSVLEIGPGKGIMTTELAKIFKKVVAVEIDCELESILNTAFLGFNNIDLTFADFLELSLEEFLLDKFFEEEEIIVCANIPYYITSPIVMKLLEYKSKPIIKSITVLLQKETAERFCAKPGSRESAASSIASRYYSKPQKLFTVKRGCFFPIPDVDSAVLTFDKTKPFENTSEEKRKLFFKIVKSVFAERRKQILNPLSKTFLLPKDEMSSILIECNIKPTVRAEELTMENFSDLRDILYEKQL